MKKGLRGLYKPPSVTIKFTLSRIEIENQHKLLVLRGAGNNESVSIKTSFGNTWRSAIQGHTYWFHNGSHKPGPLKPHKVMVVTRLVFGNEGGFGHETETKIYSEKSI